MIEILSKHYMKALKTSTWLFMLVVTLMTTTACAQTVRKKAPDIKQLIESRNYVFVAQSAVPMSGGVIQLISPYDVKIASDTLTSELPYFGTAYTAPVGSTSSPLSFTSTDFEYSAEQTAKGNYNISIKVNTPQDPDQLNLSVSPTGYGSLTVSSTHRQSITFNGYIRVTDPKSNKKTGR